MSIRDIIIENIELNGAEINEEGTIEEIDSITFISLVLDLEAEFNIEIPDEYLLMSVFSSVDNIVSIIETLITAYGTSQRPGLRSKTAEMRS